MNSSNLQGPIGVFDSGYGGLTVLQCLRRALPQYSYVYLGDNARAPYGIRSFDLICRFTRQAVEWLQREQGCPLVVLACNTASAKALRTIQQQVLPLSDDPTRRVLGVIRPTAERVGAMTRTRHVGILGTPGTVASRSYDLEIAKLHPDIRVTAVACPMWVSLVENGEAHSDGADWFVRRDLQRLLEADPDIDTVILGCTHYPLLLDKIRRYAPEGVTVLLQGDIVADALAQYLARHPEMDARLQRGGDVRYYTTEDAAQFDADATRFLTTDTPIRSCRIDIPTQYD